MNHTLKFIVGCLLPSSGFAVESSAFKEAYTFQSGWVHYGLMILMLIAILILLAKKLKTQCASSNLFQLLDKQHLGHKTIIYMIQYQHRRLIVVDNQQALAIHEVTHET